MRSSTESPHNNDYFQALHHEVGLVLLKQVTRNVGHSYGRLLRFNARLHPPVRRGLQHSTVTHVHELRLLITIGETMLPAKPIFSKDELRVTYSLSQYLLDRINIHDTITRLAAYSDCRDFERLGSEVFASAEVTIDNSLITSEEPRGRQAHEAAESWAKYFERFIATQHILTCILVNLPQPCPTWNIVTPSKATASANALVTFRRDHARGDTITQHGSYYNFELIRQTGVDAGSNPWRISHMKPHPFWFRGTLEAMS